MEYNKIFGIGGIKTGTSSLGKCFEILGFSHKGWDQRLYLKCKKGDFKETLKESMKFEAFEDLPWSFEDFYKKLDKKYPKSKFILTVRDTKSWINSYKKFFQSQNNKEMIANYYKYKKEIIKRYEHRNQNIKNYFKNRPNKLLVINICKGEGWEKLCPFLGLPIPSIPFPHINKTRNNILSNHLKEGYIKKITKKIRKFLKKFIK